VSVQRWLFALRVHVTLLAGLAAAGCASDSTSPRGLLYIDAAPGSRIGQVASAGSAVAIAPAVSVERDGVPQANIQVSFVVTLGGGRVTTAIARTDANGVASAGAWTLGAAGANEVLASIDGVPSIAFSGYAIDLPTGADAYDLIGHDGESLPADEGYVGDPNKVIAERLILGTDSTYSTVIVDYNWILRTFDVEHNGGAYARAGATLTFAGYAGDTATGVFQVDLLTIHAVRDFGADTAPFITDDVYRLALSHSHER
jgi:hypothetical protein